MKNDILRRVVLGGLLSMAAAASCGAGGSFYQANVAAFEPRPGTPSAALMLVGLHVFRGLQWKTWSPGAGWSNWLTSPYPAGRDPSGWLYGDSPHFPIVSWPDGGNWRSNAYFGSRSATLPLGAPWWTSSGTNLSADYHPGVTDGHGSHWEPSSGVLRRTNLSYLHFFGETDYDPFCAGIGLRERWWNADLSQWSFVYHGCPRDFGHVKMGPQAATVTHQGSGTIYQPGVPVHTYVAVTARWLDDSTGVWVRHASSGGTPQPWQWYWLGRPAGTTMMDTKPIAISHDRGDGVWRTHVFVTALNADDNRWHLYEKYVDTGNDSNDWLRFTPNWGDHGRPAGLDAYVGIEQRFRLNVALTWGVGSALRIRMYGATTYDNDERDAGGQLVEYLWDGVDWRWGPPASSPTRIPDGMPNAVHVVGAAVFDGNRRISVITLNWDWELWERQLDIASGRWDWISH